MPQNTLVNPFSQAVVETSTHPGRHLLAAGLVLLLVYLAEEVVLACLEPRRPDVPRRTAVGRPGGAYVYPEVWVRRQQQIRPDTGDGAGRYVVSIARVAFDGAKD